MNYTETAVIYSPSLGWVWPTLAGPVRLGCTPVFNVLDPGRLFSWGSSPHGSHHTRGRAQPREHVSGSTSPLLSPCTWPSPAAVPSFGGDAKTSLWRKNDSVSAVTLMVLVRFSVCEPSWSLVAHGGAVACVWDMVGADSPGCWAEYLIIWFL